jgi:hypothetical protein
MRTTLNIADDALLVAKRVAARERISLSNAVSQLVRAGAVAGSLLKTAPVRMRGRFALLPQRDEVIAPEHVRELMDHEGM